MGLKLDTRDIFQSDVTSWGETCGLERVAEDELTIWLSGHKASFTPDEAWALTRAIRELISLNPGPKRRLPSAGRVK